MKFKDETFKSFDAALNSHADSKYIWGLPGKALDATHFTFQASEPGKVYVRVLNEAQQVISLTTAVNLGANLDPKVRVRMEYINGQLTIVNPDPRDAARAYGNNVSQTAVPPHSGVPGGGLDDYVTSERFTPGLVLPRATGGMYVTIQGFRYDNVTIPTQDLLLVGTVPTNPYETRLSAISYNPETQLFEQDDGVVDFITPTDYTVSDADAIAIPSGNVPLAAVVLFYGMTSTLEADAIILDLRQFLDPIGGTGHEILVDGVAEDQEPAINLISSDWLKWIGTNDPGVETEITVTLDPDGVTDIGTPNSADLIPIWDDSANEIKYVSVGNLPAGSGGGSLDALIGRVIYDNTLGADDSWDVQESALPSGITFAEFDFIDVILMHVRSNAAVTTDLVRMLFATGGGALDTTFTNYRYTLTNPALSVGDDAFIGQVPGTSVATAEYDANQTIRIYDPGNTSRHKMSTTQLGARVGATSLAAEIWTHAWENTGAIDRIGIRTDNHATDLILANSRLIIVGYKEESIGSGGEFPTGATMWHDEANVVTGAALTRNSVDNATSYATRTFSSSPALDDEWSNRFFIADGSYTLWILAGRNGTDSGIMSIYIDGVLQGTIDLYNGSSVVNQRYSLAVTVVGDGVHRLNIKMASKHASSSGYHAILTKYWLQPSSD